MRALVAKLLMFVTRPFFGKGFIHKRLPFLHKMYEFVYTITQKPGISIVSIPLDLKLKVYNKDTHVGMSLLSKGTFEPVQTSVMLNLVKESSVVVDVGANFGYYTMLFGKKVGSGEVIAFEPDKRNVGLLRSNVSFNNLSNITVVEKAVGDVAGEVSFKEGKYHMGKSAVVGGRGDYTVPAVTLDNYCAENNISSIDVLKLDVEGSELSVIKGGVNIIKNSSFIHVFVEFNLESLEDFGYSRNEFFDVFSSVGLVPRKIMDEVGGEVLDYSEEALDNVLRRTTYTNLLFGK